MQPRALAVLSLITLLSSSSCERAASPAASAAHASPGICPMCPGVAGPVPGRCPRCGMAMTAVPTARVPSCPLHGLAGRGDAPPSPDDRGAGERCPVCGRGLLPVTMARVWRCPRHAAAGLTAPGPCSRCGSRLEERLEPLPHGDHNPRHGGILFMASDQWHHLEGAWPSARSFRLYLYDDFTRPIPAQGFKGRAVLGEEGPQVALAPAGGGAYLGGDLGEDRASPLSLTAFVELRGREERFDFTFQESSREPGGETAAAVPAPLAIPASLEEIAAEVLARDTRLRALIARGAWDRLYLPALEAKDLALALEERAMGWDEARRAELGRAVRALVRGAWLLDLAGDRGDGERARQEHALFEEGITILRRLFPGARG